MVKLKAIRHTGVKITDVTKAKEFYGKILGMTELPRPELPIPGAWYECNGVQVQTSKRAFFKIRAPRKIWIENNNDRR